MYFRNSIPFLHRILMSHLYAFTSISRCEDDAKIKAIFIREREFPASNSCNSLALPNCFPLSLVEMSINMRSFLEKVYHNHNNGY